MSASAETPFDLLGGEPAVRKLVSRFYEIMARDEPALARLHPCDEEGRVAEENQEKFALYFMGWLGGPQEYVARYGHPRLRMRHGRVAVDSAGRDAWMRAMRGAMEAENVPLPLRAFLDQKLFELADHMRNQPG